MRNSVDEVANEVQLPKPHRRSLRGLLKPPPKRAIRDWREAQEAIEKAVVQEFVRRESGREEH
jgi:hypothetical protein